MAAYENLSPGDIENIATSVNNLLTLTGMPVAQLAREAGVNQPMAHRVAHGMIKKRTPAVRRLELYVHIRLDVRSAPDVASLDKDVLAYLKAGGDISALRALIRSFTEVMHGRELPEQIGHSR